MIDANERSVSHVPEVSAIVVNYNAGGHLFACVEALLRDTRLKHIWVVDNASIDNSLEAIDAIANVNVRVSVIRNGSNTGFGAANNVVLRMSEDMDWLLVNPDCVVESAIVGDFWACRQLYPRSGVLGGLVRNPDGSEQRGCRRDLPTLVSSLGRVFGLRKLFGRRRWTDFDHTAELLPAQPIRVEAVSGAFMYLRAEALRKVGIFDEDYFLHCEDLDICKRMANVGWEVWFVPTAVAVHFQGTSSRRMPLRVHWHKHRSMWRYYIKFQAVEHGAVINAVVWLGIWMRFGLTLGPLLWRAAVMRMEGSQLSAPTRV